MSYENTKCPCGDRKEPGTMLCNECVSFFSATIEYVAFQNTTLPLHTRRSAAIKLVGMARRRKRTIWPPSNATPNPVPSLT